MVKFSILENIKLPQQAEITGDIERWMSRMETIARETQDGALKEVLAEPKALGLLHFIFQHSPFLSKLITLHPALFVDWCGTGTDALFQQLLNKAKTQRFASVNDLMQHLRIAKREASLLIALADLSGLWPLEMVTAAMSDFAESSTQAAVNFLLLQAHAKKEIVLPFPEAPERESGFFVLAMGKMGARELNYSSDIDLIVLFDKEKATAAGIENPQQYFPKLTRELSRILQERTGDGYVFRVDLRLRPDPASTPVALSTAGAITYYETVGQNWERAALIKARPVAGDTACAFQFLKQISPFIWRKHLDFAAIADIQSIKRQMDARSGGNIDIAGHNIKVGLGGIREIEFFVQIHQLIWGGRMVEMRLSGTCRALATLAETGLVTADVAAKLAESYRFYRTVEHRLQMVDDQQTHTLPTDEAALIKLSHFCGFTNFPAFQAELLGHLKFVHHNFSTSFCGQGSLGNEEGTLSFTGVENNPETVETIRKMGFKNPETVSEVIQSWHRGARRATRTKRARELITELTPALLKALAATTHADQAFNNFDAFLSKLPAGIQIFSLFQANTHLLHHIAVIMGSAPAMAESLSKNVTLLDTILTADFFSEFPDKQELFAELSNTLLLARDFEDEMDAVRRFKSEKQFQAGVQLLHRKVRAEETRHYLSDVAEVCIEALMHRVEMDFISRSPQLQKDVLAIVVMGRLGARDLTFGSDIDMIFLFDESQHELSLEYNKLSKRFVTSLTALTSQGRLYEADTRLRPSGKDGAIAVSTVAFDNYFHTSAWTFEFMALTRARVITGKAGLQEQVRKIITDQLTRRRDKQKLVHDILDLRARVDKEFGTKNVWNLKYTRGGLMDIDFLSQYFILLHAHDYPDIVHPSAGDVFRALHRHKLLRDDEAGILADAHAFLNSLFTMLRLCGGSALDEQSTVPGVKAMIAGCMQMPHFGEVRELLRKTLAETTGLWNHYIKL